jgi:translation initiation factor 2 subunit 1
MRSKKEKNINKILKVGKEEVQRVISINAEQNYLELSKKAIKTEEIENFKEYYHKSKTVHSIMKLLSVKTGIDLEELLQKIC